MWNGKNFSPVVPQKTGENQEMLKIKLSNGLSIKCTPYHRFFTQNSYHGKPVEVRAHALKVGDKLIKVNYPIIEGHKELAHPYANGFFTGDGTICTKSGHKKVYFYQKGGKLPCVKKFDAPLQGSGTLDG